MEQPPKPQFKEHLIPDSKIPSFKRGGSFRMPQKQTRIPVLKPSGKEYSQEAEPVDTNPAHPVGRVKAEIIADPAERKISMDQIREHWEKNQRKWGSSQMIDKEADNESNDSGDSGKENGLQERVQELHSVERSTDFKDLKGEWEKKNMEKFDKSEHVTDVNDNSQIDPERSPGFKALKEQWEHQTAEADESL